MNYCEALNKAILYRVTHLPQKPPVGCVVTSKRPAVPGFRIKRLEAERKSLLRVLPQLCLCLRLSGESEPHVPVRVHDVDVTCSLCGKS